MGEKAPIADPTFTGTVTAPDYEVPAGDHGLSYIPGTTHQAGNVGSVGLIINDGGGPCGVFVENLHDGTYSWQEVVITVAQGGVSTATEILRVTAAGVVMLRLASIPDAASDAAAAGAGILVGGLYRTGSAMMIRTV
jgi:hypothetical protein